MRNQRVSYFVPKSDPRVLGDVMARIRAKETQGAWPQRPRSKSTGCAGHSPSFGWPGGKATTTELMLALGAVALVTLCALLASLFVPASELGASTAGREESMTIGDLGGAAILETRHKAGLDFSAMAQALGGTLTPELSDLNQRIDEAERLLSDSVRTYERLGLLHASAVREGRVDEGLREGLDAQARSLRAQSKSLQDLNGEAFALFRAALQRRRENVRP